LCKGAELLNSAPPFIYFGFIVQYSGQYGWAENKALSVLLVHGNKAGPCGTFGLFSVRWDLVPLGPSELPYTVFYGSVRKGKGR
jgi:hypothetical protein